MQTKDKYLYFPPRVYMKRKLLYTLFFASVSFVGIAQSAEETIIREILSRQNKNWNDGNIKAFMEDYWKSDSLMFIGKAGVIYGWKATEERYFRNYPDRKTMGQLSFDIKKVDLHSSITAWVLGSWQLTRPEVGDIGGYFTLIFKKIDGKWVIVSDHTS
jgi:hypothetical protein